VHRRAGWGAETLDFETESGSDVQFRYLPNREKGDCMALDAGFVTAVLGIEGTLEEVIERLEISELRASLDVLQSRVKALRVSIEPHENRADAEC
jgi:hypothetical protein